MGPAEAERLELVVGIAHIAIFLFKVALLIFFFIWVRWTLPRFRYDQLMRLGWNVMMPLALLNMMITAAVLLWRQG